MLIPIGHDQQTVQRLPWVTFALLALNILCFLVFGLSAKGFEERIEAAGEEVWRYWEEHTYLTVPEDFITRTVPPGAREEVMLTLEARRSQMPTPEPEIIEREQAELEARVASFKRLLGDHPYLKWGLVPSRMSLLALLTSMFMHGGWLHLLGNMFILYLAGPPVEDAFGRPIYGALYLLSGFVAALTHVAAHPGSEVPLVGASGAIAGVMGAFLIRHARSNIRFFYFIGFSVSGTFDAPAWVMLPLWLLQQAFFAAFGVGDVAYLAHVGGFIAGALAALALRATQVEERIVRPSVARQTTIEQPAGLDEGLELLAQGEIAKARDELRRALIADPRNPDVNLAIWQSFAQEGAPERGVDFMVRVIEDDLRRHDLPLGLEHWRELVAIGRQGGPSALRWRLANELLALDRPGAREVLEHLAGDGSTGLLGEKARHRLNSEFGDEEPLAVAAAVPVTPAAVRPPAKRSEEANELDWVQLPPLVTPQAAAAGVVVEPCLLEGIQSEGLMLRGEAGAAELLPFPNVEAIGVGGVSGSGKPYVVLDLVLAPQAGRPRRVCRALSTQFDPRRLIGRPTLPPIDAFRELVRLLVGASGARLLPGPQALDRVPVFATLEEYGGTVLKGYE